MNIDKKALKAVVDEIEASRTRQKGETEFQREALKRAAKNHQLDAKAVRIVLQRRAMGDTKRDEQDYYVHAYELALGGKKDAMEALERGASTREAAKIGGISNGAAAALAKGAQKSSFVSAPHDPKTGEITDSRAVTGVDGGDTEAPSGELPTEPVSGLAGEAEAPAPITDGLAAEAERLGLTAVVRDLEAKHRPDTRTFDEIAGPLPDRLRRERERA